ncbi:MAG: gliding motility lipoprotein GldH [Bacteroidales bacterium]
MIINKTFLTAVYFVVILLLTSCDAGRLYDQSREISPEGWHKDSAAVFMVDIGDTLSACRFMINLRHTTDYRYSNFYLFMNTYFPNQTMARDTIELILADKTGEWRGSGFGNIKDLQVPVRKNLRFPATGTYRFEIRQAMRQDTLKDIQSIGIRIEKQEE